MLKRSNVNLLKTEPQYFSYFTPTAMSVQLVGDFTNWQESPIPLRKEGNGVWRAAVRLAPGAHQYRFLVDGQWRDDPACPHHAPNPFGSRNAVRRVN